MPSQPDRRRSLLAKLDTAADITAIPFTVILQLEMKTASEIEVAGYDSPSTTVSTHLAGSELPNARIRRIEVIPISEDYVLLGRDVLNLFHITLDGPDLTFELR